jgi:hypothetical protein
MASPVVELNRGRRDGVRPAGDAEIVDDLCEEPAFDS